MQPDLAEAVAAIKALTAVIKRSQASTMMGLEIELKNASEALKVRLDPDELFHPSMLWIILCTKDLIRLLTMTVGLGPWLIRPGMKPLYHCLQAATSSCVMLLVQLP